jgi:hypothetical protein
MLGGAVLGLATFAAAASVAAERATSLSGRLDFDSVPVDLTILNHAGAWRAIVVGLVGFALWAAIGIGLAACFGRWVKPLLAVPLGALVGFGVLEWFDLGDGIAGVLLILMLFVVTVPILPAISNAFVVELSTRSRAWPLPPGWS